MHLYYLESDGYFKVWWSYNLTIDWWLSVAVRIGTLYLISGVGGSLLSSLFMVSNISVGASGALFGLLGSMLSELITNWTIYENKVDCKIYAVFSQIIPYSMFLILFLFRKKSVRSTLDSSYDHCHQHSCWDPSTCWQLRSPWRICVWVLSWFCAANTTTIWIY